MLLIHFRRLTASQEEYLANLWIHTRSGCGQSFCRKAVQVCVICLTLLHILASIAGTYRLLLLVHFKPDFFSVTVRSFRDGSPVYGLTFRDAKRRGLDRGSSDLVKRIAGRLWRRQIATKLHILVNLSFLLFIVWCSEEDRYPAYLAVCIYSNVLCKDAMG